MPLLGVFWQGHFFFHTHPVISKPAGHPDRERWDKWCKFQVALCEVAAPFYSAQLATGHQSVQPFVPDTDMLEWANTLGVKWNTGSKQVTMRQDPFLCRAFNLVRAYILI